MLPYHWLEKEEAMHMLAEVTWPITQDQVQKHQQSSMLALNQDLRQTVHKQQLLDDN